MTNATKSNASLRVLRPEGFDEARMWRALRTLLRTRADLVPQDPGVLAELFADAGADAGQWARALSTWTERGELRCLIVGRQKHLALGLSAPDTSSVTGGEIHFAAMDESEGDVVDGATLEEASEVAFEVEVAIDVERERLLLYRVVATLGGIGLALLLREFLLLWADL